MRYFIIAMLFVSGCHAVTCEDWKDWTDTGVGCVDDCLEPAYDVFQDLTKEA